MSCFLQATCKVYCEFEMGDINKVLRVGEKVKSPDDPCSTYVCDVSFFLLFFQCVDVRDSIAF